MIICSSFFYLQHTMFIIVRIFKISILKKNHNLFELLYFKKSLDVLISMMLNKSNTYHIQQKKRLLSFLCFSHFQ